VAKLVGRSWNASYSGQTCIRKPDAKATIFQAVLPCRVTKPARLRSESPAAEVPVIQGLEGGYVRSSEVSEVILGLRSLASQKFRSWRLVGQTIRKRGEVERHRTPWVSAAVRCGSCGAAHWRRRTSLSARSDVRDQNGFTRTRSGCSDWPLVLRTILRQFVRNASDN
jgi:hypothetical protein